LATHLRRLYNQGKDVYKEQQKSVDFVVRYNTKGLFTPEDALGLANYLVFHGEITKATNLLRPFTLVEDLNENLLGSIVNLGTECNS
jgi:hypothetical protein